MGQLHFRWLIVTLEVEKENDRKSVFLGSQPDRFTPLRHQFNTTKDKHRCLCVIPVRPSWLCRQPVVSDTPS